MRRRCGKDTDKMLSFSWKDGKIERHRLIEENLEKENLEKENLEKENLEKENRKEKSQTDVLFPGARHSNLQMKSGEP